MKKLIALFISGFLMMSCGDASKEKSVSDNVEKDPGQAFDQAMKLVQDMKADEALVILKKLTRQKEYAEQAYSGMGLCYFIKKQPDSALQSYEKALQLEPGSYMAQLGVGSAYLDLKKYDQALEYFRIARQNDPFIPDTYHSLAIVFDRLNQPDSALANAKKYLEMAPDAQYDYDLQQIMKKYNK